MMHKLINTAKVARFIWRNIYYRYGVPHTIVTDNGEQFNNKELISFARTERTAYISHPWQIHRRSSGRSYQHKDHTAAEKYIR